MPLTTRITAWISRVSTKVLLQQKLASVPGIIIVALVAAAFGYLMATKTLLGFGLIGGFLGVFTVIICLLYPEVGLYINIIYSFLCFHLSRFLFNNEFPVGVISDILIVSTLIGLFTGNLPRPQLPRSPVVVAFLVLYAYIGFELFNPFAHSFSGWLQTIRKIAAEFSLLYIGYNVLSSLPRLRRFIIVLFIMSLICGIYGCIQQWHGLFNFELAWAMGDENRFGLIFINGDFRKFSTMSDPTGYGIMMAVAAVFFSIVASGQKARITRIVMYAGVAIMALGMAYSGTRTANAMAVAGLALFIFLTIDNKTTRIFAIFSGAIFIVLMYGPFYGNATINRFRTTFTGSDDESYKVRKLNKAFIQPYIHSHPIGGGLGTTGAGGLRYNSSHALAGFPPDSGYLKIALEFGWIGLAIICILYFTILKNGIRSYFSARNRELKMVFAACVASFFCFYVAQFAQDSLGQITDIVVYYPLIGITLRARDLDAFKDEPV